MHHFKQASFIPSKPDIEQAECHNLNCDYYYTTLSPAQHASMTVAQREGYLKVRRQQRARSVLVKAQEDLDLRALFAARGLNRAEVHS
jgi:hypothetical protein